MSVDKRANPKIGAISDWDSGGEGGPNTLRAALSELEILRRSLPFDGRIRTQWFLVAAVATGALIVIFAVAPLR